MLLGELTAKMRFSTTYLLTGDRHKGERNLSEEELQIINILVVSADGTWVDAEVKV